MISEETLKWAIEEIKQRLNPDKYNISFKYLNEAQGKELLNFLESLT